MALYRIQYSGNFLMHHGVKGQRWGIQNGPPYPLDRDTLAKNIHSMAKTKEPKITKNVKRADRIAGSEMYGLEHRLKTKESIKRKIETKAEEDSTTESKAARSISDAVRYTTLRAHTYNRGRRVAKSRFILGLYFFHRTQRESSYSKIIFAIIAMPHK